MGQIANHDAAIAAIETAFKEFEEEKADIYEMGKIAKVSSCTIDYIPEFHLRWCLIWKLQYKEILWPI